MNQKINRSGQRSVGNLLFPLIVLAFLVLMAMGIAYIWHVLSGDAGYSSSGASVSSDRSQSDSSLPSESISEPSGSSSQSEPVSESSAVSSQPEESSGSSAESAPPESSSAGSWVTIQGAVEESERVGSDYFDDAVFVGDSLTDGIRGYEIMTNTTVLAGTGVGIDNYFTREVIKNADGTRSTIPAALDRLSPGKIYLMLGTNALGYEPETFKSYYGKVVASIKESHPESIVYVQSMMPATSKVAEVYPTVSNAKINEYNLLIQEVAQEQDVYYVYVHEALADANGELPLEASPKDGIHFGPTYYVKWFDYLRTHTVRP